jgi:hypothetical protein
MLKGLAEEEILRREIKELREHQAEMSDIRPKKKRKVLGSEPLTVKEARVKVTAAEGKRRRQQKRLPTRSTRTCKPIYISESSASSSSESSETEDSDVSVGNTRHSRAMEPSNCSWVLGSGRCRLF